MKSQTLLVESDSLCKFAVNLPFVSILFHIHVFTFSKGDTAFGIMTLTLPFLPSVVATAMKRNRETFIRHLPVAQLWTHQEMLRRITTLQNDMAQWKALLTRLEDDNSMNNELVDDLRNWIVDVQISQRLRAEAAKKKKEEAKKKREEAAIHKRVLSGESY